MKDKKYPIGEARVAHIHDLMRHARFAIEETIRCLQHSTLEEISQIDEMIAIKRVAELKLILPSVKDLEGMFSIMEKTFLKREASEVSGWDIAERIERIGDTYFPQYFEKFKHLESSDLDNEKLKARLKVLRKKSLKALEEMRELSFEYKDLGTAIKDGEYNSDERNAEIEKMIEDEFKQ